ncbi:trp operon repressor [uncultured Vibrio sp.]|uniref:trp operon repressor n=1 Tax=uncultured Vibrio sp. TaxID=114054 RepID=UPI0026165C93|nr:trp operon repressor [uncultured Vibrio sp.]
MASQPEYDNWQQLMDLVKTAAEKDQHELLLTMIMSSDERDALVSRINIICELMKGEMSQRQVSQMLGVGVATITRGSNELKAKSEQEKAAIAELLLK